MLLVIMKLIQRILIALLQARLMSEAVFVVSINFLSVVAIICTFNVITTFPSKIFVYKGF